jgi:putative nucleotidyltransferase with HDIG domain
VTTREHARILEGMRALPFAEIYEVGGSLRDELLGREPKDLDFLVRGHDVDELLAELRRHGRAEELTVAGRLVGARFWPRFGPRGGIEVVPPRRETPIGPGEPDYTGNPHKDFRIEPDPSLPVEADLERRDFTVNAIARDVRSGELIDPFGGRDDLRRGVLRAVHPTSFRDDPLRILRGVTRRARDGLVPDEETRRLMVEFAPRIADLSAERVREALDQTLLAREAGAGLRLARDVGALTVAIPELVPTIGADQRSKRHVLTLDEHIFTVVDAAAERDASLAVRLAALFHDVGKPDTEGVDGPRVHARVGAEIAEVALTRLTYDTDTIRAVIHLVREHPYHEDAEPTALGARRFLRRVGRAAAADLMLLRRCDRAATGKPPPTGAPEARDRFEALVRQEWERPVTRGELAVHGDDLIEVGIPQGPALGAVIERLLDAVVDDPALNERERLLALAREAA